MTPERDRRKIGEAEAFIHGVTVLLGLFGIGYGALTIAFSDALWAGAPTYDTAMSVPHAPESWGVVTITAGALILVGEYTRRHLLVVVAALLQMVWCAFFAVGFAADAWNHHVPFGLPGTWVYFILAALMAARARLAWSWRA